MLRANLLLLIVFLGGVVFAQPQKDKRHEKRERIQAQKIAFISTELDLTTEEAQEFWPVYNQYEAEIDAIRLERRGYHKKLKKADELPEGKAYDLFELVFQTQIKESDVRLVYLNEFSKVLGKNKAAKVFIAEEKFKRELLHKLKKDGVPPPPPDH